MYLLVYLNVNIFSRVIWCGYLYNGGFEKQFFSFKLGSICNNQNFSTVISLMIKLSGFFDSINEKIN